MPADAGAWVFHIISTWENGHISYDTCDGKEEFQKYKKIKVSKAKG